MTPSASPNALGIVRAFGRRGIPVSFVNAGPGALAARSRYVSRRVALPPGRDFATALVEALLRLGAEAPQRLVAIPTCDDAVLALARHRHDLERYFHLPVADVATVECLVDKRRFYRLLESKGVPHPRTWCPESLDDLLAIGYRLAYPLIVKPSDSMAFRAAFRTKVFVIRSAADLERAASRLRGTKLGVMLQEIIPGRDIYAFYAYFDRDGKVLARCGYDKVRQYEADFGSGSFCISVWRDNVAAPALELLRSLGYHGFAEAELKLDPRDGSYKLLEINPRTTLQNRLPAACGVDVEYVAYRDCLGERTAPAAARAGVRWVDDLFDLASLLTHLRRGDLARGELLQAIRPGKVRSVAAWDDPLPWLSLASRSLRSAIRRVSGHR